MKEIHIVEAGNVIATVHFPDITTEERRRRLQTIYKAAADLLKDIERRKENGKIAQ